MAEVTFTRAHCDVFSPANSRRDDDPPERGAVVDLLVRLDRDVPDSPHTRVLGLNLHRHWNDKFLTCLWYPHRFNGFQVNEIYLRYGRSKAEMEAIERELDLPRLEGDSPDFGSFPSHVHISIGVGLRGFFYQLVIGPRAWPDHNAMMSFLRGNSGTDLLTEFGRLERAGYILFFGEEEFRGLDRFQRGNDLFQELSRFDHMRGEDKTWFGVRKDVEIQERLVVRSEDLSEEIRRMYPAFALIARRQ